MREQYDTIIIGAGIIGANIGFELSKAGYTTLNIDKLPAAGYGSTSNSCAIIRTHYSTWAGVAMAYEGLFYWEDWPDYLEAEDELGLAEFHKCGGVYLGNDSRYTDKVLPLFDEIGVPYEIWDAKIIEEHIPGISLGRHAPPKRADDDDFFASPTETLPSAVYSPAAGYISDPQLATHNLQRAAEAKGGEFLFNTEVADVRTADNRVLGVTLADGTEIDAPIVVNVAGPHSFVINEMAGVADSMEIKTRALRHEVHHLPSPDGLDFEDNGFLVGDDDLGTYFRPEVGNNILIGSQDPDCDPQEWVEDPDDYNRNVTRDQWHTQAYRLATRLPELGIPNQMKGIVDLYDVSDDWIPIYDKTDLGGFYLAIGTSGNQFKNAAVAAVCMAELIGKVEAGHDHDTDPVVVTGRYTGLQLDLRAFSRNREINRDSSFSVLG
ncbi:MAG: FAD-binding oxidoreductase [bacterium]|nr:FAD-binding oxidoreductase [bacterium]